MGCLIPLCPFIKRVQYLGFSTLEKEKELGKTNGTVLNGCLQKESDLENLVFFSSKVFGSSWFWYLVPTLLFGLFFVLLWFNIQVLLLVLFPLTLAHNTNQLKAPISC